ncbi:protein of unknown function [Burkholderia multivorans]
MPIFALWLHIFAIFETVYVEAKGFPLVGRRLDWIQSLHTLLPGATP